MAIVDPFDTSPQEIIDPFDESTEPAEERPIPELRAADPMTMWEKAKTIFKDPDKEGARAVQALVDSEIYGIRPSAAYKYRDALDRGEKIYPQATMLQSSMWERINQSKDIGITQNRMGEIGYDYILTGNPKSLEQMFELESGLPKPEETYISEGRLESAVRAAAKMLPMMLDTARESSMKGLTVGALFGGIAALAGQAGPQIALPEEIITIPAATAVGFKIGATEGMFEASLRKEAGLALSEIIRLEDAEGNRIDPNLARAAAFGIGTINAAIEVAQLRTLMKTVPGLNKLFSKAIAETVTDKTVLAQLSGLAKQYLGVVSTETGQEIAQESTNIVFEELSKKLSNMLSGTDIKPADADAIFNRLRETAVESAQAFSVIAVPGIAMQAAGVRGAKQAAPVQKEVPVSPEAQKPTEIQAPAAQPVAQAMSESDLDALIDTPEEELDAALDAILEEEAPTRLDAFREQVANVVDEEQADAVTSLLEARAKAVNMTADEYLEYHNLQIEEGIAPEDKNALLQSAFHGTPYRFDKFTLDHIGEGEGAQAYGWGLYFAGKREVAEYYKEQLAKDAGQLYEVDIPGDDVLLDWDKPLKDQIQSVKKSIKNLILLDEQWADYINQLPEKAKSTAEKMVFGELPVTGDKSDIHWSVLDKSAPGQDHNIIHDMRAKYGEFEKLNGGALYGLLYYRKGGAEEASKTLASMGLKGIRYLDQGSRQVGEGTHNYVIFDADAVKILNTFYQKAAQTEGRVTKASVVFEDQQTIIRAFESADVSSLVHELGHVFRRDLNANDLAIAGEWAGAKEGAWDTDAEEKWARGFERYLAEGKAPTEQLRTIFEQFKQWLLEIYQAITGSDIDVNISPEVRRVFDGLLAEKPAEALYQKGPASEARDALSDILTDFDINDRQLLSAIRRDKFDLRTGKLDYGDPGIEVIIGPKDVSGLKVYEDRRGRKRFYDPSIAELEVDPDGFKRIKLKPGTGLSLNIPAEKTEGILYRGMSAEEYSSFVKTGELRSSGEYNLGPDQAGLTYFSTDPEAAAHYATGFSPWQFSPLPKSPAYVVAIRDPGTSVKVEGTGEHERGLPGAITTNQVVAVYQGKPYAYSEGAYELVRTSYGSRELRTASGVSPGSSVGWKRVGLSHLGETGQVIDSKVNTTEALYQKGQVKETVKGKIRRETGQVDVSPVISITERKALRESIKSAVRSARAAKAAGKAEGIAAERERLRGIIADAKARRTATAETVKDIKAIKRLSEAKGNIAVEYQKKIKELTDNIDYTKMTQATKDKLRGLADYIDKNGVPLGIQPKRLAKLKRLSKTAIRDLSPAEIKNLRSQLETLKALGKLKQELKYKYKMRERDAKLQEIARTTNNLDPNVLQTKDRFRDKLKVAGVNFYIDTLHTPRVAELADNFTKNGPQLSFIKEMGRAEQLAISNSLNREVSLLEKLKALGVDVIEEGSDSDIKMMINIRYREGANKQAETLMKQYGYTDIPKLTKLEESIIETIRQDMEDNKSDLVAAWEEVENEIFPEQDVYYLPLKYEKEEELIPDVQVQGRGRTTHTFDGFSNARRPGVNKLPRVGVLQIYKEAVLEQEWYKNLQPIIEDVSSVVLTDEYRAAAGQILANWWKTQIDITARRGWSASAQLNAMSGLLRRTRHNLNNGILLYKGTTFLLQPFAVFDGIAYVNAKIGPSAAAKIAGEMVKSLVVPGYTKSITETSTALQQRKGGELAISEELARARGETIKEKVTRFGFKLITESDLKAAAAVQEAVRKVLIEQGMSDQEALSEAEFVMRLSQGDASVVFRPHILGQGEGARTWFTFQSFIMNRWGIIVHDLIMGKITKGEFKSKMAGLVSIGVLMLAGASEDEAREWLYEIINRKSLPKDSRGMVEKVLVNLFSTMPFLGNFINAASMGYDASPPVIRTLQKGIGGTRSMLTGKTMDKRFRGFLDAVESGLIIGIGMPGTAQFFDVLESTIETNKD